MDASLLTSLTACAADLRSRAYVPFSGTPVAAVVLLADGDWIPGVRVESASFSLTLPALVNAYTTAVSLGRASEVVAAVLSRPLRPEDDLYLNGLGSSSWEAPAAAVRLAPQEGGGRPAGSQRDNLPDALGAPVSPAWPVAAGNAEAGIAQVRRVAQRAHVPESAYPVGALLDCADGTHIPGVNVEHPDWTRILCAERNAIGTAHAYGLAGVSRGATRLFLTCLKDAHGTPCGACRQWIAELTPEATLWMDRHDAPPASSEIAVLLPGSFQGHALLSES